MKTRLGTEADIQLTIENFQLAIEYPTPRMLVGILSDTHDRAAIAALAVRLLKGAGAEFLVHCGDVGGQGVLDELAGLSAAFVWGNNDYDEQSLARYAESIDVRCLGRFGALDLGGKSFAVLHGDDWPAMSRAVSDQRYDYVLHGHTHVRADKRVGRTRVINPGALH